jgi:hypothetical protein
MADRCTKSGLRALLVAATAAICVIGSSACRNAEPHATPAAAIESFYSVRIAGGARGTPSVDELERLAPFISVELHDLLAEALLKHHKLAAKTQERGRTFSNGDLFSSLFDGPTSLLVGGSEQLAGDQFLITVKLTSAKQLPALKWSDKVRVVREGGHYVVADIEYANHWAFGSNTRLVHSLQRALGKDTSV